MIDQSKKFYSILKELYNVSKDYIRYEYSFDEIMNSNESRLDFLLQIFGAINEKKVNSTCKELFDKNIDFIYLYINGEYTNPISVSEKYFNDKNDCLIVPTQREMIDLFKLIKDNIVIYNALYKDEHYLLKLPDNTFNMNMYRILEIKYENLAHLMGLTESESKPDPKKNLLKKYFKNKYTYEERKKYGKTDSEQLMNWVISNEGLNELLRLNQITIDFIKEDMKNYPNNYENGVLKIKSLDKFKKRFKESTSYDYPIIKFSRFITKSTNNINYFNMKNISTIILDYTSELNKDKKPIIKDEKDIFIINIPIKKLYYQTKVYIGIIDELNRIINLCAKDINNVKVLDNFLSKYNIDQLKKDILDLINIAKTHDYVSKHGIEINNTPLMKEIGNGLNHYFENDIHIIGFGTNFDVDDNKNVIPIPLDKEVINSCHCDTSISLYIADFINEYYRRGRSFFLDKIEDGLGGYARISIPEEEIYYRKQMSLLLGISDNKIIILSDKLSDFNKLCGDYGLGGNSNKYYKDDNNDELDNNPKNKK